MERTIILFALFSLLVCSLAQQDRAATFVRPHVTLGSGTVTCALVPQAGITLTATCEDRVNPPATITAVTDEDGLFKFDYFTDFPEFALNAASATCRLDSVQPAVVSKPMVCGGVVDGSCSISLAPTPLVADMSVTYTAAPAGCTPRVDPVRNEPLRRSSIPCPKTRYQILGTTEVVHTVQDLTIPVDSAAKADEDTCASACMATPDCAHYSFNCMACALYRKGAIALDLAQLDAQQYDITSGSFVCPTNIGTCR